MLNLSQPESLAGKATLADRYRAVRSTSEDLVSSLLPEDFVVQSMVSASPAKWHLAHVSWFFEQFVLKEHMAGYRVFSPRYDHLFNSYYQSVGVMHARPDRGLLTRPAVGEIYEYRRHIDQAILQLLSSQSHDIALGQIVELGLHHEQQHQELLLTDLQHAFSRNPLEPAWRSPSPRPQRPAVPLRFLDQPGGIVQIGASPGPDSAGSGHADFCFDNESPRHRIFLEDYALANRPVNNSEYREFIVAGGYRQPSFWLSDGWQWLKSNGIERPLYWDEDCATAFSLLGRQAIDWHAPVCHISYYEADAFARWAGARLPTEGEWEAAAASQPITGNLQSSGRWQPEPPIGHERQLLQVFGDVWEWTASAYSAYPGFKPLAGSLGEYNGKFMCNQIVCRGGSCVTPADHLRATYRNFFYPGERWQFFGFRLAHS
ncbi:MAG: ergothioneine biosynthesis protein EgtB [Gammaproteobacteria bacterium]